MRRFTSLAAAIAMSLGLGASGLSAGPVGPLPYLSFDDSPFKSVDFSGGYFHLETFEDGKLDVPGVSAGGTVVAPGPITDSVDADDGVIDGSGTGGHSFFSDSGAGGISFSFDKSVLGALPTHAGIVWTDGAGTITFQAFDAGGALLGTIGPASEAGVFPDNNITGETAEDRFFGWIDDSGISRIFISNTAGGIEVDHLQYGNAQATPPPPPPGIPLPAPLWGGLLMLAAAGVGYRVMRLRLS